MIAEVEPGNIIRVRINDDTQGLSLFDVRYAVGSSSYTLGGKQVPFKTRPNLFQFAIGAWVSVFVARADVITLANAIQASPINNIILPQRVPPSTGDPTTCQTAPCIAHDLVCSFPQVPIPEWSFTGPKAGILEGNKQTMDFVGMPCLFGPVKVDLSSCCFSHDRAFWCSRSPEAALAANIKLADCIASKLVDAIVDAYNNFWSLLCLGVITIFTGGWAGVATLLDLGAVYFETVAWIELLLGALVDYDWIHKRCDSYWDLKDVYDCNGSHQASCLCGGKEPTTPCDNDWSGLDKSMPNEQKLCRDLCKEVGTNNECCFDCGWTCSYDSTGQLILGKDGQALRTPKLSADGRPCCPGTDPVNRPVGSPPGSPPCMPQGAAPPCASRNCNDNCSWYCSDVEGGGIWTLWGGTATMPCCADIVSQHGDYDPCPPQVVYP
jgi:hypothetical protein